MLVHGRPLVYWDDAFGYWWPVSQSAVRSDCVVVAPPSLDQDLGLSQRIEDLAVQKLVPEAGIEPSRVSRRLQLLSRVEHHEQDNEQVFP
jgi:hypothetical protein